MCELALSGEGIMKDPKTSKENAILDGQASDLLAPCFQPRRKKSGRCDGAREDLEAPFAKEDGGSRRRRKCLGGESES